MFVIFGKNSVIENERKDEMPMGINLTQGDAPSYRGREFHVTIQKQIINT
jgi:hypothetical protein